MVATECVYLFPTGNCNKTSRRVQLVKVLDENDHRPLACFVNMHTPMSGKRPASPQLRKDAVARCLIAVLASGASLMVMAGDTNFKLLESLKLALNSVHKEYDVVMPDRRAQDDYIVVLQPGWTVRPLLVPIGISYEVRSFVASRSSQQQPAPANIIAVSQQPL